MSPHKKYCTSSLISLNIIHSTKIYLQKTTQAHLKQFTLNIISFYFSIKIVKILDMNTLQKNSKYQAEKSDSKNSLFSEGLSQVGTPPEEIHVKNLKTGKIIGSGVSGIVFTAFDSLSEKVYAVKKLIDRRNDPKFKESIIKELEFTKTLKHQNHTV